MNRKRRWSAPAIALGLAASLAGQDSSVSIPERVEFNREVRPILSDRCFPCHGPDEAKRSTKLRFDVESVAKSDLGGRFAIVPGNPEMSEMVRRIATEKKALRMPPAHSGEALKEHEIAIIRRWIEQGAEWQKHWAYIPPKRPNLPKIRNTKWPRNPIDRFVLARLERDGLAPSAEAGRARLIRRVSLDLTGLPPTPQEVDAFLKDTAPNAYEKVVDRLLASSHYGERMAARWLDAARYADTNGYQTDAERYMWRWRDWVIEAFNQNKPFDIFTIEQLAGDLLPNATLDQKIATGFNRNHRGNGEGGIIPEEYAVEYVADRVETTSMVWLGMTMGCARCHDHKYDPIAQKEYYQLYAFFNNIPERGKAFKFGNSPPLIPAPTPDQQVELTTLEKKLEAAKQNFARLEKEALELQKAWERSQNGSEPLSWAVSRGALLHFPLDGELRDAKPQDGEPQFAPGRLGQAAAFDGKYHVDAGDKAKLGFYDEFTLSAWIYPSAATGAIVTRAQDIAEGQGYGLYLKDGKVQANFVSRWLDDCARVETAEPLTLNEWHHVAVTYDGSRVAEGITIYVDGKPRKLTVLVDEVNQNFIVKEPLRIGAGLGPENRFRGSIDEVRIHEVALTPREIAMLADRQEARAEKLRLAFLETHAPAPIRAAWKKLSDLQEEHRLLLRSFPTVMVMRERAEIRPAHILKRGAYDKPGEKVTRGVPSALPPLPSGAENNRLGLARWLVDPSHPLTARVIVNRFWAMYFGTGIVKTVEDFGSQGEWPSHPDLLDWLATEFVRTGWDMKALQKTIVMSATYRQTSSVTPQLLQKDPENRLLARGPRLRLPAEIVRDQALAASGLLVDRIGGPSVKPYQPAGLWKELSGADYQQDSGENLFRRSLYTFWKRAVPPPNMMLFDSAGRESCVVNRAVTNTPLQALTLMNDVTYLESSRRLAQRMLTEGGQSPSDRVSFGFRLALSRPPTEKESAVLLDSLHHYRDRYQSAPEEAAKLLSQGEAPRNKDLDPQELAAYSSVASLILNLDETVTKE